MHTLVMTVQGSGSSNGLIAIREAVDTDVPAVQAIYSHYVTHSLATFEESPPSVEEMRARRHEVLKNALPYLVAEMDGEVVGYSYATYYRARPAYRYTVEDSVYIANGLHGRGIGRLLLSELVQRCEVGAWRQMVAIIGDSGNAASIALHRRAGFNLVGTLNAVGFKLNRWVDTVLMQRPLGMGAATSPFSSEQPGA